MYLFIYIYIHIGNNKPNGLILFRWVEIPTRIRQDKPCLQLGIQSPNRFQQSPESPATYGRSYEILRMLRMLVAAWWFGAWILFFHMLGIIIPIDYTICFQMFSKPGRYTTNQEFFNPPGPGQTPWFPLRPEDGEVLPGQKIGEPGDLRCFF